MKKSPFVLVLFCLAQLGCLAQITIAEARLAAVGSTVTFKGLVTNGSELGTIRYLQDLTAGIAIYDFNAAPGILRGDSVLVTGTLVDYNGLLEVSTLTSFTVLNSGNSLPVPQLATPIQINEDDESELVQINGVTFNNAGATFAGNTTYAFVANGEALSIYVRNGSPLIGQPIPAGAVDMVCITSQYQTNYQVLPRDMADFLVGQAINITSLVSQTDLTQEGFTLHWTTDLPGTSGVSYGLTPALEIGEQTDAALTTDHALTLMGLEAGQIFYCQAFSVADGDTAFSPIKPYGVVSLSSGSIIAYFNTAVDTTVSAGNYATQLFEAIDDTLIAYINRAEATLDLTIYDFNNTDLSNISTAINNAAGRGVQVRFISDGTLAPSNTGIGELSTQVNHMYSPTSSAYNIMHNKFVIIDANHSDPMKPIVWTGSTNWTDRQINRDNNSVIILQDQTLARSYTIEFNEMWGSNSAIPDSVAAKFGSFKTDNTPHDFIVGGKKVESYFSPSDNVNSQLINTINAADSNAYFASMLITRSDVAQALVNRSLAGVDVMGIIDDVASTTQYGVLSAQLTPAELFVNPDTALIMHHKYLITDFAQEAMDPTLWVGSHNWSNNANTRNDENTLVIHDADIVNQYYQEFHALIGAMPISGCTSANACNYNSAANVDDGSCLEVAQPCDDGNNTTFNDIVGLDCICAGIVVVNGCTDINACNYSSSANADDGSCLFVGDACDDGNVLTENDSITADCMCVGIVNDIDEMASQQEWIHVFPNPADGRTTLQWNSVHAGLINLIVSDAQGRVVISRTINCGAGQNTITQDFTQLTAGHYQISLQHATGILRTRIMID